MQMKVQAAGGKDRPATKARFSPSLSQTALMPQEIPSVSLDADSTVDPGDHQGIGSCRGLDRNFSKLKRVLGRLLCFLGFHAFRDTEVTFGFGTDNSMEKVKCIDGLPCLSFRQLSRPLATNEVEAQECSDHALSRVLEGLLLDAYRPGKPATF
jgi:hypothetical protein